MIAVALDFGFVGDRGGERIILRVIGLFPVEGGVGDGDDLNILERFFDAANFISGGRDVDGITFLSLLKLTHVFFVDDMVLSEVITRGDDADDDGVERLVEIGFSEIGDIGDSVVKALEVGILLGFFTIAIGNGDDDFGALSLEVELIESDGVGIVAILVGRVEVI